MVLDPQKINAQYTAYLETQALKQADHKEAERQLLEQKARIKAQVEATRLNEIHTATDDYICECCGKTIPEGTRYRQSKIPVGYGFPEGVHYSYRKTHLVCPIKKEA